MPYKRVIVPILGEPTDQRAIELAASVANSDGAEITLVHVVEVAQSLPLEAELPHEIDAGERSLENAEEWCRKIGNAKIRLITPELLQARSAGTAIVDEAIERNADLIVMALRNHKRHGRPTVGETVPYVLKNAPCEVLITRLAPTNGADRCDWTPEVSVAS